MGGILVRPAAGRSFWQSGTIENGRRVALAISFGHHQRKNIFYIANKPALQGWLVCFFTGRVVTADGICWHSLPCGEHRVSWGTNPLRRFAPALPKGEPRLWRECFLPLPLKDFPRSGEDVAQRQKGDKVSPKVTERAHPLPCGELPPQRLRGLQIGEARKKCNGDDRRQRRIQGGAVGAAVSRTRVPLKARSGRWAPQPVLAKRLAFFRFDFCFGV